MSFLFWGGYNLEGIHLIYNELNIRVVYQQFESQDILVPWRTPDRSSSEEKADVGGNEHESIATTTTTSDEDVTHYHAYSQTSESDSCYSCSK